VHQVAAAAQKRTMDTSDERVSGTCERMSHASDEAAILSRGSGGGSGGGGGGEVGGGGGGGGVPVKGPKELREIGGGVGGSWVDGYEDCARSVSRGRGGGGVRGSSVPPVERPASSPPLVLSRTSRDLARSLSPAPMPARAQEGEGGGGGGKGSFSL